MGKRLKILTYLMSVILLTPISYAQNYPVAQAGAPRISQEQALQQQIYQQQLIQYQRELEQYQRDLEAYNQAIQAQQNGGYLQAPPTVYYGQNLDNDSGYIPYKGRYGNQGQASQYEQDQLDAEALYYSY